MIIDLRSDTVTRPTPAMLDAMMSAKVGDDVFEEDPSVNALEEQAAKLFGKEAAIFCPSGTMTNQIAIRLHTHPGHEVICDKLSHIYNYEAGGIAANSLCSVKLLSGEKGLFKADDVLKNIQPDDVHAPITSLVALENTCNKGGGSCWELKEIEKINKLCKDHNLKLHLDGARIFNALIAKQELPKAYGVYFDTISICLSKGLGAPIGSLLLGEKSSLKMARRYRKLMGGGMRQVGFLAAAGIYALENNINRLQEDHHRAKLIGEALQSCSFVESILPIETNIVVFDLANNVKASDFLEKLKQHGILAVQFGSTRIRFVTHLDFCDEQLTELLSILRKF